MIEQDQIKEAGSACRQVLSELGIHRVICVDDTYESSPSLEDVIGAASSIDASSLKTLVPEIGDEIPEDISLLSEMLRRIWADLAGEDRAKRGRSIVAASRIQQRDGIDDVVNASLLEDLIPADILETLSPTEWQDREQALLQEAKASPSMLLFDRDLSESGGGPQAGIKIIASILSSEGMENSICGLLTHTVTPGNLEQVSEELSREYGINRDRFLVIPKAYLSQAPVYFAELIKYLALTPDFVRMKEKASEILRAAADAAEERVESIEIHDLNDMVFRISDEEGIWEPDVIFRLYSLFQRSESRRLAFDDGELEEIASRMRAMSLIPTQSKFRPRPGAWRIQKEALYEAQDHINHNFLPLELGDIFVKEKSESTKRYVVLVQPCDLMVRSKGERAPKLLRLPMAEIVELEDSSKLSYYTDELKYFGGKPEERWAVKLKRIHFVHVAILDMCVFDADGRSVMWMGQSAPAAVRPTWQARYSILQAWAQEIVEEVKGLPPIDSKAPDDHSPGHALASRVLDDGLFKGEVVEVNGRTGLSYNCRRVRRLSRERALGVLMAYTSTLSRPAYAPEFG